MRVALALAATIALPIRAAAQTPAPAPAPAPTPVPAPSSAPGAEPAPSTDPAPAPAASPGPGDTAAPSEAAPAEEPKVDPAYGERPEPSYDTRDFPAPRGKDVVIVSYPDRSKKNIMTLAILGGAGLLTGAIGLYFHMDARSATDDVGADTYTGEVWTDAHQETYDRAHRSSITAGVFYGIGGALLLATAIGYIATEPKAETMVIHPHASPKTRALIAPTRGGAILGGAWRF